MTTLSTSLDPRSATFQANAVRMHERLAKVQALQAQVVAESSAKADKFEQRGQLLPRERVARLLDRGTPFLELSPLAGLGMHDDDGKKTVMGGGSIIGIGIVAGRRVLVSASDSAIKGGTVPPMGLKKALRAQEIARENKLPFVHLVESGGANLLYQSEMFVEGGRSFANQARLSAAGIPQIAVVHGSSTAGGAYLPGLADYVVLVRGRSSVYLAGPPLVKAAIGEEATDEELGGAQTHAEVTGLGEYLAENDAHAIALARELLAALPWDEVPSSQTSPTAAEPLHRAEELMGVVPADEREPYDVREVIARLADGSEFLEFKASYATDTICGHARLGGHRVGLIGNNGPIQPTGSTKAAQFIQLCDQAGVPLVFLQNTTGYMVGKAAERAGAIKHGSKMIQAVANARVPKFTVVLGGSFGAGNYGMCGRGFDPRFIFSWPSARTAVMGGAQAAQVMEIVSAGKVARGADPAAIKAMGEQIRQRFERESDVLFGTARLWDDGVIDPRDTRRILTLCLDLATQAEKRQLRPNTFGVARL